MKLPKHLLAEIEKYADQIRSVRETGTIMGQEEVFWSGEDLLLCNVKEVDGEPVNPNLAYSISIDVIHHVNHKERMITAYKRKGRQGIADYLKTVTEPEYHEQIQNHIMSKSHENKNV